MKFLEYFLIGVDGAQRSIAVLRVIRYPHPNSTADDKGSKTPSLP